MKLFDMRRNLSGCALLALIFTGSATAAPKHWSRSSDSERQLFARQFPHALARLDQADAAAASGRLEDSSALFAELAKTVPNNPTVLRRHCEVLTDLGQKKQALATCEQAAVAGQSVSEVRSKIGALMSGPPATVADYVAPYEMTAPVVKRRPHLTEGHAAMFDIARHLGDQRLMAAAVKGLQGAAPDHYETKRALALSARPAWELWLIRLGWAALAALCVATLVRIIRINGRRRTRHTRPDLMRTTALSTVLTTLTALLTASILGAGSAAYAAPATAGALSSFKVNEADPESSLPTLEQANNDPINFAYLVMDLADKGDRAMTKRDFSGAIKYYRALVKVSPDVAIPYSKMCTCYEELNDRANGIAACKNALAREGVQIQDYDRYVRLVLATPASLTDAEKKDVTDVVANLQKDPNARAAAATLQCQYGVRVEDLGTLAACTKVLSETAPNEGSTIAYQWAFAMARKDRADAEQIVKRAKQVGMNLDGVKKMELAMRDGPTPATVLAILAVCVIALGAAVAFVRRREILAALDRGRRA